MARLLRWSMKNGWPCHSIKYLSHRISKFYISFFFASLFTSRASHFLDEPGMHCTCVCELIAHFSILSLLCVAILSLNCSMIIIGFAGGFFLLLMLLSSFIPFFPPTLWCGSFDFNVTNEVSLYHSAISIFMFDHKCKCINCDLSNVVNRQCMYVVWRHLKATRYITLVAISNYSINHRSCCSISFELSTRARARVCVCVSFHSLYIWILNVYRFNFDIRITFISYSTHTHTFMLILYCVCVYDWDQ